MNALLAVLIDTWHESKKQIVFRLLLVFMLLGSVVLVIVPRSIDAGPGEEPGFGTVFSDEPVEIFKEMWWASYVGAEVKALDLDTPRPPSDEYREWMEARREAARGVVHITGYERSVQMWIAISVSALFKLAMIGFIAACAGYFPHLMREGAVDAVVSKPLGRLEVFLGKYVGGLLLFSLALTACHVLLYLGLAWRLGVWQERIFLALAFEIFVAAVLYAFLACMGILSRSAVLATVLGYGYYLVVDTVLGLAIELLSSGFVENDMAETMLQLARRGIPNFTILNDTAISAVITMPHFDWEPFATASVWTLLMLVGGFFVFQRRDF